MDRCETCKHGKMTTVEYYDAEPDTYCCGCLLGMDITASECELYEERRILHDCCGMDYCNL